MILNVLLVKKYFTSMEDNWQWTMDNLTLVLASFIIWFTLFSEIRLPFSSCTLVKKDSTQRVQRLSRRTQSLTDEGFALFCVSFLCALCVEFVRIITDNLKSNKSVNYFFMIMKYAYFFRFLNEKRQYFLDWCQHIFPA